MAISILTNIPSLLAQSRLSRHTRDLYQTYTRLSTGLRINKASDDAAGLAIADTLRADTRIAQQAILNTNDALSVLAVADGGLNEIGNILTRLLELAETSANGVYTTTNRSPIQAEFSALMSEITRISRVTSFNGVNLLSGASAMAFQVGLNSSANSQIIYAGVNGTLQALGLGDGTEAHGYSVNAQNNTAAQNAAFAAIHGVQAAIQNLSSFRGAIGSAESRLSTAVNELRVRRENYATAEDTIRSADIAQEAANLVRQQILQQAATAILVQANQTPALALSLLS
ncbi:MAG: flagellin [Bdellovibrionota bacterium]